jgi:hypothetical protein
MAVCLGRVGVMGSGLLDTSSCGRVGALVDGGLHLLEELVDVEEVGLGPQIGHRRESILMLGHGGAAASVTTDRHHGRAGGHVIRHPSALDWDTLEEGEAVSNLSIGRGVDLTTLGIAKEVVQSIITLAVIVAAAVAKVGSMVDGIVDWAVRAGLLRLVVAVGSVVLRRRVRVLRSAVLHMTRGIVVPRAGCWKVS